jgi:hypothetical protein
MTGNDVEQPFWIISKNISIRSFAVLRWCRPMTRPCFSPMRAWCSSSALFPRGRKTGLRHGRPPPRNAYGPAASTTIWKMWATRPGTTPFSRCWGTFSFGDYFKEKAIDFAWDLLTNGYGLPADKLWVSSYLDDDEAFDIWHRQDRRSRRPHRALRGGRQLLGHGRHRPLRPLQRNPHRPGRGLRVADRPDCGVDCDCDRYLEIWNLVFMQFNRDEAANDAPAQAQYRHGHGAGAHGVHRCRMCPTITTPT